jgi:hypothetical protein
MSIKMSINSLKNSLPKKNLFLEVQKSKNPRWAELKSCNNSNLKTKRNYGQRINAKKNKEKLKFIITANTKCVCCKKQREITVNE